MLPKDVSSQWWRVWQIPEFLKGFTQSTCKACVNNTQILFACALRTVRGILALYWHDWGCVCWHSSSRRSAINGGDYYTNRFDTVHVYTVLTLVMVLMWHNWCGCGWEQGLTRITAPTTSPLMLTSTNLSHNLHSWNSKNCVNLVQIIFSYTCGTIPRSNNTVIGSGNCTLTSWSHYLSSLLSQHLGRVTHHDHKYLSSLPQICIMTRALVNLSLC